MRAGFAATAVIVALMVCAGQALGGWQTFTVLDGLPYNRVLSIEEDHNGRMWFGCHNGVALHDGATWKTYSWTDIVGNEGYDIFEDSSGNIWVGGRDGVSRFDGQSWKDYTPEDGLAGDFVEAIAQDKAGNMWFGTWYDGVSRFDGESWTTFDPPVGGIYGMCATRDGRVWVGGYDGASKFDGSTWRKYDMDHVESIFEDRDGNLWFGLYPDHLSGLGGGVKKYDGKTWTTFTTSDGLANNHVGAIAQDRWGDMWFGCGELSGEGKGVSRYDGRKWRIYTVDDGLACNEACDIAVDRLGNLWFGTYGAGVCRYDGVSWSAISTADGLAENCVNDVMETSSGELWLGTCSAGLSRYDRQIWTTYTTEHGLPSNQVTAVVEDLQGDIWAGTLLNGVSRYDGQNWKTYTVYEGLAGNSVRDIVVDQSGVVWIAGSGVSRFDGSRWAVYTEPHGLADNNVFAVCVDRLGNLWFGTEGGVSRFDGVAWTSFDEYDGLPMGDVRSVAEDASGRIWAGTERGIARYDGQSWTVYTTADGLADDYVRAIARDRTGILWIGTNEGGVCTFNGECWSTYDVRDGLASNCITSIMEDSRGALWFGSDSYTYPRVAFHEPDRVPPKTLILAKPAAVSTNEAPSISFGAGYLEVVGISFSYSLDGSPWSEWSSSAVWEGGVLPDGPHVFEVKARDKAGNVDPYWPVWEFEIDATPPAPVITSPHFSEVVRDTVAVHGTADDARFERFFVEIRPAGSTAWKTIAESPTPVSEGALCRWNTRSAPDGEYELRLSVSDTLGLVGRNFVRVLVDNVAPWANQTAPAIIRAATGGEVYSADGEVHLYFPPRGFEADTEVRIAPLGDGEVPDTLSDGAEKIDPGYEIAWDGTRLEKQATLEMLLGEMDALGGEGELSLRVLGLDSTWRRIGGTVDEGDGTISCMIGAPGRYTVFRDAVIQFGDRVLSGLTISPRAFSPRGGFAASEAAIGFTLGRPGAVTVKIFNRAGRVVREVAAGEQMNAGANIVPWDGRDGGGDIVEDGVYLVTVEALGARQVKPLAVVR